MKQLHQLIDRVEPAWPLVKSWAEDANNPVEILPAPHQAVRESCLLRTQVTTRAPMGAIIYESGGILVDGGWIRILGSGHPRLPRSLPDWNASCNLCIGTDLLPYLLVADDAVGGFFAIDGGGLGIKLGHVCYSAPDTLEWEDMQGGFSQFVTWCFSGDLEKYYTNFRWHTWKKDVLTLKGDQAFNVSPPMWAKGPAIGERSRGAVPMTEVFELCIAPLPEIKILEGLSI